MDTLFVILLGLFALLAGFGLGAGNYHGLVGAIIPGLLGGLLAAIPAIRERQWAIAGIMVGAAFVGAILCAFTSDSNRVKSFCRNQKNLVIRIGPYYKLGVESKDKD